ncbi:MAG: GNAT family N-acetyltransferase [Acidobacteriia bacterium]|nr:GNAT family N-acetyltransferase [Terriglobia bacterium]
MAYPILDHELARRVELAEAGSAVACAELLARLRPDSAAAVEPIAGGYAVFCGINSPITQAVAIGLAGTVSAEEIARLEEFYFSRGDAVRVEMCPLADPSVFAHFGERGYRVTEFSSVMARPLSSSEHWPDPTGGLTVEQAAPEQAGQWAQIVAQGFAEEFPVTPELLDVMSMFASAPGVLPFFARLEGEIAGGGCLSLRGGVAGLFGASTLPAFRKRGVQTALLQARLARGASAGCSLAVSLAQPASISEHNILRQGFATLYTRVKFEKPLPG